MHRSTLIRYSLVAAFWLCAGSVFAADGGAWSGHTNTNSGNLDTRGIVICDAKVAAEDCGEVVFATNANGKGLPSYFTVQIELVDPTCSGTPDFEIRGLAKSGGQASTLATLTGQGTSQSFDGEWPIIDIAITDDAACDAPGNTVGMILFYEK